ncbi:MAG TPA: NUDIX hydrolase [Aliidongia sp.]|nr:NUDIX hydrolase [Aliidongia sp.]
MEDQWLAWTKRLQAIASTGMNYCRDDFDRERYQELALIAHSMLSALGDVPLERIIELVPDFAKGYATPKIDVRGAIIESGRILLVREKSDGLWTLPGGYADIGLSPAENLVKEVWEEAGLRVAPAGLIAVRHKAKHAYVQDMHDSYKLFFLCRRVDSAEPAPGPETTEVGFFDRNGIPPLSRRRTIERDIEAAFAFHAGVAPAVD